MKSTLQVINLADKLSKFDSLWDPKIIAELNGQMVKVAKLAGEFEWHHHDQEDEFFLVVSGTLRIECKDSDPIILTEGECVVVPAGVSHRPVTETDVVHVLLFEPASTVNTGNIVSQRTRNTLERI